MLQGLGAPKPPSSGFLGSCILRSCPTAPVSLATSLVPLTVRPCEARAKVPSRRASRLALLPHRKSRLRARAGCSPAARALSPVSLSIQKHGGSRFQSVFRKPARALRTRTPVLFTKCHLLSACAGAGADAEMKRLAAAGQRRRRVGTAPTARRGPPGRPRPSRATEGSAAPPRTWVSGMCFRPGAAGGAAAAVQWGTCTSVVAPRGREDAGAHFT